MRAALDAMYCKRNSVPTLLAMSPVLVGEERSVMTKLAARHGAARKHHHSGPRLHQLDRSGQGEP
ncbi:MAG: hypothetical protein IPG91_05505 [Ideonella sp.]|nr:hypothetical protein [Ideonella sp.]